MKLAPSFVGRSFALSLVLHAAVIAASLPILAPAPRNARLANAELTVWLREPAVELVPMPEQPRQLMPLGAPRNPSAAAGPVPKPVAVARLEGEAAASANEQLRRELPYPPEAIERGLQGEALVLLFLDASGNAIAARIESSSGHAILDDAALRAARTLRALRPGAPGAPGALPTSAPREVLLPVRFRLR